jgi:hypothetical protein
MVVKKDKRNIVIMGIGVLFIPQVGVLRPSFSFLPLVQWSWSERRTGKQHPAASAIYISHFFGLIVGMFLCVAHNCESHSLKYSE